MQYLSFLFLGLSFTLYDTLPLSRWKQTRESYERGKRGHLPPLSHKSIPLSISSGLVWLGHREEQSVPFLLKFYLLLMLEKFKHLRRETIWMTSPVWVCVCVCVCWLVSVRRGRTPRSQVGVGLEALNARHSPLAPTLRVHLGCKPTLFPAALIWALAPERPFPVNWPSG